MTQPTSRKSLQNQLLVNIRANENAMVLQLISVNKEGCCVVKDW